MSTVGKQGWVRCRSKVRLSEHYITTVRSCPPSCPRPGRGQPAIYGLRLYRLPSRVCTPFQDQIASEQTLCECYLHRGGFPPHPMNKNKNLVRGEQVEVCGRVGDYIALAACVKCIGGITKPVESYAEHAIVS